MGAHSFFEDQAKSAVRAAIERIEGQTAAEVVVTVRRRAGDYHDADFLLGAIVALASLVFVLFAEREFATRWIPLDVVLAFALGSILSAHVPDLRRLFVSSQRRAENTRLAACAAFVDQKIGRTSGRNGILVLVALFERKVAVVGDLGVEPLLLGPELTVAINTLKASVERRVPDVDAFVHALESLAPGLATAMPRLADDVNELPDDVGVA